MCEGLCVRDNKVSQEVHKSTTAINRADCREIGCLRDKVIFQTTNEQERHASDQRKKLFSLPGLMTQRSHVLGGWDNAIPR